VRVRSSTTFIDFAKVVVSGPADRTCEVTKSHWPDVMVRGSFASGSCKKLKLSACFYGLVSSIQKKFFTPIIFLCVIQFRHIWHLRYIWSTYFSSKTVCYLSKVTLLVHKLLSETYIFSVVFVINSSWRKVCVFCFWKSGLAHPAIVLTWQKSIDNNPG